MILGKLCEYISEKCNGANAKRKLEDQKHYNIIKEGLNESMLNINKAIENIGNWDELMNIKEQLPESIQIQRSKTIEYKYKKTKCFFIIFGIIFCLIHLIGVQASIIILNSLFSEIVDEITLWLNNTPRIYNFYEKLEINSYKELPEIDVAMVTSSIGIIVLKEIGFKATNSIFQLISSLLFSLLIILFNFHTGDKLLENYNGVEIFTLIISYILLSILVGCCSTISLKEFFNLFNKVFYKSDKISKKCKKILFNIFSGLSTFAIIFINRLIFTSFNSITSKWFLISIVSVCFASFFMSLIFHILFSIPVKNNKGKMKIDRIHNDYQNEIEEDEKNQNEEELKENEEENKEDKKENKILNNDNKKVALNILKSSRDSELITLKKNKKLKKKFYYRE